MFFFTLLKLNHNFHLFKTIIGVKIKKKQNERFSLFERGREKEIEHKLWLPFWFKEILQYRTFLLFNFSNKRYIFFTSANKFRHLILPPFVSFYFPVFSRDFYIKISWSMKKDNDTMQIHIQNKGITDIFFLKKRN